MIMVMEAIISTAITRDNHPMPRWAFYNLRPSKQAQNKNYHLQNQTLGNDKICDDAMLKVLEERMLNLFVLATIRA